MNKHIAVIGSGIAGLTAALRLVEAGARVTLISKGLGGLVLSQGTVDVLGRAPDPVTDPFAAIDQLPSGHPYRVLGADRVREHVGWLVQQLDLIGDGQNMLLPTAAGALRPTAYAPASMVGGDARATRSYAVVGISSMIDFHAPLVAGNLARQSIDGEPIRATSTTIDFVVRDGDPDPNAIHFAQAVDDESVRRRLAKKVADAAGEGDVVLVPAVIGLHDPAAWADFEQAVGRKVAEVTMQPPNAPGMRLYQTLIDKVRGAGTHHVQGAFVEGFEADGDRVTHLLVGQAGHQKRRAVDGVIHAPGGFESGALTVDSYGAIHERVFDLPLTRDHVEGLVVEHGRQPLFEVGVPVEPTMRVTGSSLTNLYVAGGILAGAQRAHEHSGEGIAIASAVVAADNLLEELT